MDLAQREAEYRRAVKTAPMPDVLKSAPAPKQHTGLKTKALQGAVHGLDSYGAIPLGGKVSRFAKWRGGRRSHSWGMSECRR